MLIAGPCIFFFFIPLHGGGICGGPFNNPFGMAWPLQTTIWLSAAPLFFAGIGGVFFDNPIHGAIIGLLLESPLVLLIIIGLGRAS
jgi:hypothetical protein